LIEFDQIPQLVVEAVLTGEDRSFFTHRGVSPRRIIGALLSNLRGDRLLQGGSTITQQLARNLFLTPETTFRRKAAEAFIALLLEQRLTKEEIFAFYANEVYLGHRDSFGIHGFAEAASAYFGKDLAELNIAEIATIAGIIPAPNAYSLVRHPDRAVARRNLILREMLRAGSITQQQHDEAKQSKLVIAPRADSLESHYFVDYIRDQLRKDFSEQQLMSGDVNVYSTVDPELQKAALDAVNKGLAQVEELLARRRRGANGEGPTPQAGLIALDPRTGEIKAMVGGARYGESQYNRVTQAFRQPGSIFKPFVYAAALETAWQSADDLYAGSITPISTLMDAPYVFSSGSRRYAPGNYGGRYHGLVTVRTAFQHSLNVPTVLLAEVVGYDRVAQLAKRMGLNSRIQAYPSIALGAFEVTPLEIAGAYTAFANGGRRSEPHAIRRVTDADGNVLKEYQYEQTQVLRPEVAFVMTRLMQDVINRGTGARVRSEGFWLPAAGKTGTSRDGWFAGYTRDLLAIAWVGFDDGEDLDIEGARSALPIWTGFMKKAYEIYPVKNMARMFFSAPRGVEFVEIDPVTLARAGPNCTDKTEEVFIAGTAPTAYCPLHANE
jgi:penicillin-binding protein 1B